MVCKCASQAQQSWHCNHITYKYSAQRKGHEGHLDHKSRIKIHSHGGRWGYRGALLCWFRNVKKGIKFFYLFLLQSVRGMRVCLVQKRSPQTDPISLSRCPVLLLSWFLAGLRGHRQWRSQKFFIGVARMRPLLR